MATAKTMQQAERLHEAVRQGLVDITTRGENVHVRKTVLAVIRNEVDLLLDALRREQTDVTGRHRAQALVARLRKAENDPAEWWAQNLSSLLREAADLLAALAAETPPAVECHVCGHIICPKCYEHTREAQGGGK